VRMSDEVKSVWSRYETDRRLIRLGIKLGPEIEPGDDTEEDDDE